MATTTTPVADATTSQPHNSGAIGNSDPDRFDASERDIAEGDQEPLPDVRAPNPQTIENGDELENDGLDDVERQSPPAPAADADTANNIDIEDDR